MQCNQSCWNGFTNGPFCSSYNTPFHSTQSMYPEIVGEGQVTSVTLPDGSTQFFFMPTLKWWTPNASQCHPYPAIPNPMFGNTNYSIPPPYNNNVGTWFIRSISNPFAQSVWNPPNPRNELSRLAINTDFNNNLNSHDFGYQVKFHNDGWTSTTDLVYFYPSLRQRDFVFTPPSKDKTVQIDTEPVANNKVCHCEVANLCQRTKPCVGAKPMSVDSLVDPKVTTNSSNASTDDSSCSKKHIKQGKDKKREWIKSKNGICACHSTANTAAVDKSITTYADEGSGCSPADGRETQTCRSEETKGVDAKPVNKCLLKSKWIGKLCKSGSSTTNERLSDSISEKTNKRDKDGMHKQSKPKKCNCGCDSSANSVCSVSENETVASKAFIPANRGPVTPYICSTCSSITTLKKAKRSVKKIAQKTLSGKHNVPLQWLKSCQQCELKKEETREPLISSSSDRAMDGISENLIDHSNNDYCS